MADTNNKCLTKTETESIGVIIKNTDGTVSVFHNNSKYPVQLTLECCKTLDASYYFDLDTQKCRHSDAPKNSCDFNEPINLIINPQGDDGVEFFVDEFEFGTVGLNIGFDYLLKIKCETLLNIINPTITTNKISDENLLQINITQQNIESLNTEIEALSNIIVNLQNDIALTPYSIECSTFPTTVNQSTVANTTSNFDNTAFGSTAVANSDTQLANTTTTYSIVNYCLTDYGLTVWKNILGVINYTQFLLGDISNPGYTCDDVIKIATQTWPNGVAINACETPFGTKSALLVELDKKTSELTLLQLNLTNEQNKLIETIAIDDSGCLTPTQALETLDIEMHLNVVNDDNTITSVFSEATFPAINLTSNLYEYLTTGGDSGFYICGDPSNTDIGLSDCTILSIDNGLEETPNVSSCDLLLDDLLSELFKESGLEESEQSTFLSTLSKNAFASNWLSYSTVITDPNIINLITNKKIKISFKINYSCIDFCLLLDNIVLDKSNKTLESNRIISIPANANSLSFSENTKSISPGFDLTRIVDNKKSWVDNTSLTNREFSIGRTNGTSPFRQTNYDINDERLVINSKEVDLDINIASAIETDVWCFLNNNYGLLTGITTCTNCGFFKYGSVKEFQDDKFFVFMNGSSYDFMAIEVTGVNDGDSGLCCGDSSVDFSKLITTDLSKVKTIDNFENFMVSELIDAKNRKTIPSYGTLRAIYERYLASSNYVNRSSSAFDYVTMDKFSNLIGDYWVDIIEQVIPSTAIWGGAKIYTNTIFDEQKFKYKEYTSLFCNDSFNEINKTNKIKGVFFGSGENINILIADLLSNNTAFKPTLVYDKKCDSVYLAQMNAGSEFIGKVTLPINSKIITETIYVTTTRTYTWPNNNTTYTVSGIYPGIQIDNVKYVLNLTLLSQKTDMSGYSFSNVICTT
jgi:hypothetical protein